MKIAIDKSALVIAIDTAIKAVSGKSPLPILEGLLLEAEGKILQVTGTDLEIGIQYETAAEVLRPGKTVVNARLLSEIIKKMPDEEIDLNVEENVMVIESKNMVNKLKTMDTKGYPTLQPSEAKGGQTITIEQQEFKDMINRTVFAVAVIDERPALKGELIEISGRKLNVVACDGYRVASRRMDVGDTTFRAIIPGKTLSDLSKVLRNGQMKIYRNRNIILFECENFFVTARTLDGEFVPYERFISGEVISTTVLETKELQSVLETSMLFMPHAEMGLNPPIVIKITDKFETSYTSVVGETKNAIKADISGENITIAFNPKYMLEAVKCVEDKKIRLEFMGEVQPLLIRPVDGDKFMYMCLPARLK